MFLNLTETAKYLGVHRGTLARWVETGKIPSSCYSRPTKRYLFDVERVRAVLFPDQGKEAGK